MIIRLPGCYPLIASVSLAHWRPNGTQHGPKSKPWLIAFTWVRLLATPQGMFGTWAVERFPLLANMTMSEGWRLWVYVRGGYAFCTDLYIDRRDIAAEQQIMR